MTQITRYEINSIYFVRVKDIKTSGGYVTFDLSKVRQKKQTISMHIYTILNKIKLSEIFKELNK